MCSSSSGISFETVCDHKTPRPSSADCPRHPLITLSINISEKKSVHISDQICKKLAQFCTFTSPHCPIITRLTLNVMQAAMEDSIDVILQDHGGILSPHRPHPVSSACLGVLFTGVYGVWSLFALPGFRTIPWKLKVLEMSSFFCSHCVKKKECEVYKENLHINSGLLISELSALSYSNRCGNRTEG